MQLVQRDTLLRTKDISDHVFPLVARHENGQERMAGTAFILGTGGYALTAAHCLPLAGETLHGMFLLTEPDTVPVRGKWSLEPIQAYERHPREDVAILELTTPTMPCAFLRLSPLPRGYETEYESWGYPERGYDFINPPEQGRPIPRPNLLYTKGYVRRTVSNSHTFRQRGSALFEVSEVAGAGYSGSPVVEHLLMDKLNKTPKWAVIGVYIGQHEWDPAIIPRFDNTTGEPKRIDGVLDSQRVGGTTVGVVARTADFGTWAPKMLGHSLIEEGNPPPEIAEQLGLLPTV